MKILLFTIFLIPCLLFGQQKVPFPVEIKSSNANEQDYRFAWFHDVAAKEAIGVKGSKIELGVDIPQELDDAINAFLSNNTKSNKKINPYNRHDIAIEVDFYCNQQLVQRRSGFFYKEFKKDLRSNQWKEDTTSYSFRVRFEPPVSGDYFARLSVQNKFGESFNHYLEFSVKESTDQGYLKIGANGKHLAFSGTGKSFFGVGQDIPWTEWEDWNKMDRAVGPKQFEEIHTALKAFDVAGGNFTRFVASPWFMQLEWEALGNYSPKLGQAWEFDRILDYCDQQQIYFIFCALMHAPLESRTDEKDGVLPGIRWETYCYNDNDKTRLDIPAEQRMGIHEAIEFYSNEKAKDHVKNYFRYLSARYGYSSSLTGWQLMSEVDETAEYRDKEGQGTTIDHSENRKQVRIWTDEISTYMKNELMDNQLISMAIIKGKGYSKTFLDPELFNLPNIDYFGYHDYMFETIPSTGKVRNRNLLVRYPSVNEVNIGFQNGSISYPSFQNKPFIYDEFGHILTIPRKYPEDDGIDPTKDFNNCADFMIKQDLWFTLSSGCAVAGLDWWNQDEVKRYEMWKKFYPAILKFTENIDFEKVDYTAVRDVKGTPVIAQRWPLTEKEIKQSTNSAYGKDDLVEAYIQVSSDQSQGYGWMSNRSVNWYNMVDEYPCLKSLLEGSSPYHQAYISKPVEDDLAEDPIDIDADTYFIKVYGLKKRVGYKVNFYSTITGNLLSTQELKSNGKGVLKVFAPQMNHKSDPDVAFKIIESGLSWK